jgi:hypothetical protein
MTERRTFGLLLAIAAFCVLAAPLQALAQTPRARAILIRVDSVLAANTGKGMDAQLSSSAIGARLKDLFEYTTYRLVLHQQRQTRCGRVVVFEMPGGRILHIAPSSVLDNMISMEIVLFEGTRPLMTTDLKLMNHAVLVVGGPRYQQGMLITMISTDASDRPGTREVAPAIPPPLSAPPLRAPPLPNAGAIPADSTSSPQH